MLVFASTQKAKVILTKINLSGKKCDDAHSNPYTIAGFIISSIARGYGIDHFLLRKNESPTIAFSRIHICKSMMYSGLATLRAFSYL